MIFYDYNVKQRLTNVLKWFVVFLISLFTTRLAIVISFLLRFIIDKTLTDTFLFKLLSLGGFWWLTTLALAGSVLFCYLLARFIKAPKPKLLGLILFLLWFVYFLIILPFIPVGTKVKEGPKLSPSPESTLTKEQDKEIFKEKTLDELGNYEDEFLLFRSKPDLISKIWISHHEGEEGGLFGAYPQYRSLRFFNSQLNEELHSSASLNLFPTETFSTVKYFSEPIKSLESLLVVNLSEEEVASKYKKLPYLPPVNAAQSSRSAFKSMSFKNGRGIRYIATFNQDASPNSSGDIFYTFQGLTNDGKTYLAFNFPLFAENFDVMKENFDEEEENISQLSPRTSSEYYSKLNELHNNYLEELTTWVEENLTSGEIFPSISDLDNLVASLLIKDFKEPEF